MNKKTKTQNDKIKMENINSDRAQQSDLAYCAWAANLPSRGPKSKSTTAKSLKALEMIQIILILS